MTSWDEHFHAQGIVIIEHALRPRDLVVMDAAVAEMAGTAAELSPVTSRRVLEMPTLIEIATRLAGSWTVLSHPMARLDDGDRPWSSGWRRHRAGPPTAVVPRRQEHVGRRFSLSVCLDPIGPDDGPLECVPGTHRLASLEADPEAAVAAGRPMLCLAERGDVLVVADGLLCREQRARVPRARRSLQVAVTVAPHDA